MVIEDVLKHAFNLYLISDINDFSFLASVVGRVDNGIALTTRQGYVAKKIIIKHLPKLRGLNKDDVLRAVHEDKWKYPLIVSVTKKSEARYLGDNIIALSFTPSAKMSESLRHLKPIHRDGLVLIPVTARNLQNLIEFLGAYNFALDSHAEEYLASCLTSDQVSVFMKDDDRVVCNILDNDALAWFVYNVLEGEMI